MVSPRGTTIAARPGRILRWIPQVTGRSSTAIVVTALLAALLRFWGLGYPPSRVFDEAYYPRSACWLLGWSEDRCDLEGGQLADWAHPPLGKYAIAVGELALGFDARDGLDERDTLSFRLPSAIAGTVTVVLLAFAASLLFDAVVWTWLAGSLLAVEGLSVVHSRVGMLDPFLALWIAAAFVAFLLDQRQADAACANEMAGGDGGSASHSRSSRWRPWRLAMGACLGAAVATKWSGAMAIPPLAVLGVAWDARRRATGAGVRRRWTQPAELGRLSLALIVLPLIVYLLSYSAYFTAPEGSLRSFVDGTVAMARYHRSLVAGPAPCDPTETECPEEITSRPWEWMVLRKPIVYWGVRTPERQAMVLGNGNAAIFWGSIVAVPLALFVGWRRRDRAALLAAVMAISLFLPWIFVERVQYLFYAVPMVPFLVLAFVVMVRELAQRGWSSAAIALSAYAVGLGLLMWPIHAARTLPLGTWRLLARLFPAWWGRF